MWLYTPSNSVPALACLAKDSEPVWNTLVLPPVLPVTSSGKLLPQPSLSRLWKRSASIRRLFGLTSAHSTLQRGVDEWIASLPVSLASRTPLQDDAQALKTSAGFGTTSPELFGTLVRGSFISKTSQASLLPEDSPLASSAWPKWGSMRSGAVSAREPLVPATSGSASSFWPSARAEDSESCGNHPGAMDSLTGASRNWATPDCNTATYSNGMFGMNIREQVTQWMTPDVPNGGRTLSEADVMSKGQTANGKRQVGLESQTKFWKTPHGMAGMDKNGKAGAGGEFAKQIEAWPTPDAGITTRSNKSLSDGAAIRPALAALVTSWPTPASRDSKGENSMAHMLRTDGRTDGFTMSINCRTS